MSKIRKATEGLKMRGTLSGDFKPILMPGQTYISLKMPTKPEVLVIPLGYVGVVHANGGVVNSISVVSENSKIARRTLKQSLAQTT